MTSDNPVVTLHGTIERELDGAVYFRVSAGMGDAASLGFPDRSAFWIGRKLCVTVREARLAGEWDVLQMSTEVAIQKRANLVFPGEQR